MAARVLFAKPGLDGHDRGAKVVVRALRDAGFEVIYTGLHQTPAMIAQAASDEDVDMICLSILSGAHLELCKQLASELKKVDAAEIPIVIGGIIPEDDHPALRKLGVKKIYGPGASTEAIVRDLSSLRRTKIPD